jgi:hypothetical protein
MQKDKYVEEQIFSIILYFNETDQIWIMHKSLISKMIG